MHWNWPQRRQTSLTQLRYTEDIKTVVEASKMGDETQATMTREDTLYLVDDECGGGQQPWCGGRGYYWSTKERNIEYF